MSSSPSLASEIPTPRPAIRWASTGLLALLICAVPLWLWSALAVVRAQVGRFVYRRAAVHGVVSQSSPSSRKQWTRRTAVPARDPSAGTAGRFARGGATCAELGDIRDSGSVDGADRTPGCVETGRAARGLVPWQPSASRACWAPCCSWYSAGQALAAGTMILAMLAALQAWRSRGSWWLLVAAARRRWRLRCSGRRHTPRAWWAPAYLWADGRARAGARQHFRSLSAGPRSSSPATLRRESSRRQPMAATSRFGAVLDAGARSGPHAQAICEVSSSKQSRTRCADHVFPAFVLGCVLGELGLDSLPGPVPGRPAGDAPNSDPSRPPG